MLGCVYAYQYFVEARAREAEASRLAALLSASRLDALRMQLNPHFLFNSLNTVLVLVRDKDTALAARMLELIADVLRQVLDTRRPHEVPLADELRFVERYLAIEQVRFSDRLRVDWAIENRALAALVPDLIMQPLVENAIRHGVARRADQGTLTISAQVAGDSLELSVRDDGAGMEQSEPEGIGLSNTKERLQTLYGEVASVTMTRPATGGTEVALRLPYRTITR
jgi:LytS/YehU family sensor histidine kinase